MAEILFIGAGLANLLMAQRCKEKHPGMNISILEERQSFEEKRTWSFHESDVSPQTWEWLGRFISKKWQGYDLQFPEYSRSLTSSSYASIKAEGFLEKLSVKDSILWGRKVREVKSASVLLENGEEIPAGKIIGGRGFSNASACGYQKFLGQTILLKHPHGLKRPLLMDATVEQTDGYRFFYLLPWSDRELLVEDTYYSNSPEIRKSEIRVEIQEYLSRRGLEIESVLSEESSALPIPFFPSEIPDGIVIGSAAGLFHPTTGYSLPYAAELACSWDPLIHSVQELKAFHHQKKYAHGFYHLLNRMLFLAGKPGNRRKIFERFCQLPEPLIQRFYAGKSSRADQTRILLGKPPVPVLPAIRAMVLSKGDSV